MKSKAVKRSTSAQAVAEEPPPDVQFTEQVVALAHALWEARGCPEGSPETDWHQAERQLVEKR